MYEEEKPVSIVKYRGYTVPIFYDDHGQQFWCKIDDEEFGFGSFNTSWKEDLYYLIDNRLDFICDIEEFPGAHLKWFFNGLYENRDIQLTYKTRILKVYVVKDDFKLTDESLQRIKKDCVEILKNYKSATENIV